MPQVAKLYPAIAMAAIEVGTPQIRNQGTVGGNLNQRPRCWYYRNEEFVCFKKGGNQCFSPAGENQFHAIFGSGPSFIVHPSSLAVPSVAYDATFRLAGPKGERLVPASDYFTMPTLQNVQGRERARAGRAADTRHPSGARRGQERPLRSPIQGIARLADRVCHGRGVDGGRHRPLGADRHGGRCSGAVAVAAGRSGAHRQAITEATAAAAADASVRDARPLSQNAYKIQVARTAVKRAILQAAGITTA